MPIPDTTKARPMKERTQTLSHFLRKLTGNVLSIIIQFLLPVFLARRWSILFHVNWLPYWIKVYDNGNMVLERDFPVRRNFILLVMTYPTTWIVVCAHMRWSWILKGFRQDSSCSSHWKTWWMGLNSVILGWIFFSLEEHGEFWIWWMAHITTVFLQWLRGYLGLCALSDVVSSFL